MARPIEEEMTLIRQAVDEYKKGEKTHTAIARELGLIPRELRTALIVLNVPLVNRRPKSRPRKKLAAGSVLKLCKNGHMVLGRNWAHMEARVDAVGADSLVLFVGKETQAS